MRVMEDDMHRERKFGKRQTNKIDDFTFPSICGMTAALAELIVEPHPPQLSQCAR